MDAYRAIVTKRDTRDFRPGPLAEDDLHKLLQAARMAGSAKNSQLNRIVVVTDPGVRARLAACGTFAEWVADVPAVFVFVAPADGNRPFDVGRMAQNIMVAAQDLGLASCPVTFHHQDCIHDVLGVPADHVAQMGVGVGHPTPAKEARPSAPRIPLDELVVWDHWPQT